MIRKMLYFFVFFITSCALLAMEEENIPGQFFPTWVQAATFIYVKNLHQIIPINNATTVKSIKVKIGEYYKLPIDQQKLYAVSSVLSKLGGNAIFIELIDDEYIKNIMAYYNSITLHFQIKE